MNHVAHPTPETLPRLDSVFDYPYRLTALASAAQRLALADARCQTLYATAWWGSWTDYFSRHVGEALTDTYGFVDRGLEHVNRTLIELQHSARFLEAQRELVGSLTRFRQRHRSVMEVWQLWNQAPTQRDVDDLAESLHTLKREVRRLRRQVEAGAGATRAGGQHANERDAVQHREVTHGAH